MTKLLKIVLLSFAYLFVGNAQASTVTFYGDTVKFILDDTLTLFGSPSVSGDYLNFQPVDFEASAVGGSASLVSDSVKIKVQALNPQNFIDKATFSESGFYTSFGDSTMLAGGQLLATSGSESTSMLIGDGPFDTTGFATSNWSSNALLDVSAWGASEITLTISNLLFSTSSIGGFAAIQKTFASLNVTAVPLPASIWLLGAALIGLISSTKRRQTI